MTMAPVNSPKSQSQTVGSGTRHMIQNLYTAMQRMMQNAMHIIHQNQSLQVPVAMSA